MLKFFEKLTTDPYSPIQTIVFIVSMVILIQGLWILSPFFSIADSPTLGHAFTFAIVKGFGGLQLAMGGFGVWAYVWKRMGTTRINYLRNTAFTLFCYLLFVDILRLITIGPQELTWLTILSQSLVMGIAYIALGREMNK